MKASAGTAVSLVGDFLPAGPRVRNEAFTLVENGVQVSVIALRKTTEPWRENVNGVHVYRIPTITLFKKLPDAAGSWLATLLKTLQAVAGYVFEYSYLTAACLAWS